jgi:Holliday junction resolvase RusA-like endonuclease
MIHPSITFYVHGSPVAKQSTRFVNGHCYTDPRMAFWQETVAWEARAAMVEREMLQGELEALFVFTLDSHRRSDLDNYVKPVADGMNKIVYADDSQIVKLTIEKKYDKQNPGVFISVWEDARSAKGEK